MFGDRNCTVSSGLIGTPLNRIWRDGPNHWGPAWSSNDVFANGSHWKLAGNPVEYRLVMYQVHRPYMIRSLTVLAIRKLRVTLGSGRVIHDSPGRYIFWYSPWAPSHDRVYWRKSRQATIEAIRSRARLIVGTCMARSSNDPTVYEYRSPICPDPTYEPPLAALMSGPAANAAVLRLENKPMVRGFSHSVGWCSTRVSR